LLIEEMSTNELSRSEDFTDPIWPASSTATITTSTGIDDPKGTNTAATITNVSGSNLHRLISGTAGIPYTYSIWIRRRNGSGPIYLTVGDDILQEVTVTNTWTRVSATNTPTTTTVRAYVSIGSTGDSIDVWGAKLEQKAFATSYIGPTLGSGGLARMADTVSITGSNFSSWYNQSEGTVFSDSDIISSLGTTQLVWNLTGGTYRTSLRQPQAGASQFRGVVGNTFSNNPGIGGIVPGITKAAVSFSGTTGRIQVGVDGEDITAAGITDPDTFYIGSFTTANQLNGTIRRLTYFPKRLPDFTLQTITTP